MILAWQYSPAFVRESKQNSSKSALFIVRVYVFLAILRKTISTVSQGN